jgi:hypothetical protein
MNICDKLRKNYSPNQVVDRVKILGEEVPVSREEALMLFGCRKGESSLTKEECKEIGGRFTERGCVAEDVNFEKLAELRGYDIPSMEAVIEELAGNLPQTTGTTYGSGRLWANWHSWKREASE